jgi:dTMP kinase
MIGGLRSGCGNNVSADLELDMLVTIEGIDGAGKSSQVVALQRWLEESGRSVVTVRDPGGTVAGEAIRSLLLNSDLHLHRRCEALLYMAARAQLVAERIGPALTSGQVVLADRFLLSNVAYQSVGPEALTAAELWTLGSSAIGQLQPDLTVLLDLPATTAIARLQGPADRIEQRGAEYLEAVRQVFLRELPRGAREFLVIDGRQAFEHVHAAVCHAVQTVLQTRERPAHALPGPTNR